jgi:predicted dienelactone hydrolase
MLDKMNRYAVGSLLAVAALLLVGGSARADQDRERHDDGTLVGHSIQTLFVTGTLGETRPVNVHLWYPARQLDDCDHEDSRDGDHTCSMTPTVYTSRLNGISLLPQWDPLSWTIGSHSAFENLPIARGHDSFPAIIFSPGHQTNVIDYTYTLEALASFGFIVTAPDHLNDTLDDVRIDFINSEAQFELIPCFDALPGPCARPDVPKSMTDRAHDISAVIDALPAWFGDRVDSSRVGVFGHSRGTVTALAAAGGSTAWGFSADPRVSAIMGLAIGAPAITFAADIQNVTVPALLVAGALDTTAPPEISQAAFDMLGSSDKAIILIANAKHRHFESGLCAQTQSAGGIASANMRAILDLKTLQTLVEFPSSGVSMDFCRFETFIDPNDIRPLVASLTGFDVTPTNVPTTSIDSTQVNEQVLALAVGFFNKALQR